MKNALTTFLILTYSIGFSQSVIAWESDYNLKLTDFQSPQTEISNKLTSYSIYSGANMDFSFQMSSYEFMFTKNFNSKVSTTFNKKAAVITAPDSTTAIQLLNFGQYSFDLYELYTRKFRKELFEQKGAFSNANFFQPIFSTLQEEMNTENARVSKVTDLGKKAQILNKEHQKVMIQIEELSFFCKECKPPKKKKVKH